MLEQQLIGKIIKGEKVDCIFTAIAEGMEWNLYSSNNVKVGDFVLCNVLNDENDEDNFYLEDSNEFISNEDEWNKQEENSIDK